MNVTDLNLHVLDDLFPDAARTASNRIAPVDAPHLRRCLKAGLLEVMDRSTLRLTDKGARALEGKRSGLLVHQMREMGVL